MLNVVRGIAPLFCHHEYIIEDTGSADVTLYIVKNYRLPISVVYIKKNKGFSFQ